MATAMRYIVNPYCFGANYLMNLIRGACGGAGNDDRSYASLLTGRIRQKNPFRRASPLIAFRLKGHEAEMDYPEEGEKSAFTPTGPSRAGREIFRDVFRKLSIYFRYVRKTRCYLRNGIRHIERELFIVFGDA